MSKQIAIGSIHPQPSLTKKRAHFAAYFRGWLSVGFGLLAVIGAPTASSAQDENLRALDGEWLFVEDRTEGRAVEKGGPPTTTSNSPG